jgi:uncharacterized protein YbaR (Trm112 family)
MVAAMPDKQLRPILVCPTDRTPLKRADEQLVARLNRAIAAGRIKNRAGRLVEQAVEGGLRGDGKGLLYPIFDGIPVLLADEAIDLGQLG